jgi:diaminohydroxyphosphoribosylaminopyrimidine deaminase/5-amino-6-(5-phosphoribosylamino)uracil reductase
LTRVVFDSRLRTPPSAALLSTLAAGPVIIMSTSSAVEADAGRAGALRARGADIILTDDRDGLRGSLEELARRGVSSLIVEGGAALHRAFWDAALVDRVQMYMTPHVLGSGGLAWLPFSVVYSGAMSDVTAITVGDDVLVEGYVHGSD